jgi:ABC-type multidrug transport system fused ATPase/permease subunit
MTGKVLDNGSAGILVLILPLAIAFVVLYKLWPFLLLLAALIIAFKIWQNYQWQKWCRDINPYFNQLIKENRGYLTPVDLSVKANLTARAAKVFLSRKSDEYGTQPKNIKDKGVVYYFPTASALGSILDDSEPEPINSYQLAAKESNRLSVRGIAQLAKQEQSQVNKEIKESVESSPVAQLTKEESPELSTWEAESETNDLTPNPDNSIDAGQSLIQAELAKRLDLNSSTVGRRKSDPDFEEWSQSKDPEGIAWRYESETKMFVAVDSN